MFPQSLQVRDVKYSIKFLFSRYVWTALVHVNMKKGIKTRSAESYIDLELPFIRHSYEVYEEALQSIDVDLYSLAISLRTIPDDILLYNSILERLFVSIKTDHEKFFRSTIITVSRMVATLETEAGEAVKRARTSEEVFQEYLTDTAISFSGEIPFEEQEAFAFGDDTSEEESVESEVEPINIISAEDPVEVNITEDSTTVIAGEVGIEVQEAFEFETTVYDEPVILAELIVKTIKDFVKAKVLTLLEGEMYMKTKFLELDEDKRQRVYDIIFSEFVTCVTPNTSQLSENELFLIKFAMTLTSLGKRDEFNIIKAKKCDLTGPSKVFAPIPLEARDDLFGF